MTNLYFVRHGKTYFNDYGKMQGWSDTPLLNESIELANKLGKNLREIPFDCVYSSDSGRVFETRRSILETYGEIKEKRVDARLREMNFGEAEGESVKDLMDTISQAHGYESFEATKDKISAIDRCNWIHQHHRYPSAESKQQFHHRVSSILDEIITEANKNNYKHVLVVSHGLTTLMLLECCGYKENVFTSFDNLSVSKVNVEYPDFDIEYVNNNSFLKR